MADPTIGASTDTFNMSTASKQLNSDSTSTVYSAQNWLKKYRAASCYAGRSPLSGHSATIPIYQLFTMIRRIPNIST